MVTFTFSRLRLSEHNARRLEIYYTSADPENDVAQMSDAEHCVIILVPGLARPLPTRSC